MGTKSNGLSKINYMDELVKKFALLTIEKESDPFNSKKANRLFDQRHAIFKTLQKENKLIDLKQLFDHRDLNVVLAAATHYLVENPKEALEKLSDLSKIDGIIGFAAKNWIEQWKNGEVNFDY